MSKKSSSKVPTRTSHDELAKETSFEHRFDEILQGIPETTGSETEVQEAFQRVTSGLVRSKDKANAEVVGLQDDVLIDASRRAGKVLGELASMGGLLEAVIRDVKDRGQLRLLHTLAKRMEEMRDIIRPVAHLDVVARDRSLADQDETDNRLKTAKDANLK